MTARSRATDPPWSMRTEGDRRMDMPNVDAVRQLVSQLLRELGHVPSQVSEVTVTPEDVTVVGVASLCAPVVGMTWRYGIPLNLPDSPPA